MPLTKSQKNVLKKIDAVYARLERLSGQTRLSLDQFIDPGFHFPDKSELERKKVGEHSRKRQQVFERSRQLKAKAF